MNFYDQNPTFHRNIYKSEIKHLKMEKNEFSYRLNSRIHAITLRCARIQQDLTNFC